MARSSQSISYLKNACKVTARLSITFGVLVGYPIAAVAQSGNCTLVCKNQLQISLNTQGQALVTPAMIAPTASTTCPGLLDITITDGQGQTVPNPITCAFAGETINALLLHVASGNSCSVSLTVLDPLPPVLNCPEKIVSCSQIPDPAEIGAPDISDNCTPFYYLNINYSDVTTDLPCGTLYNGQAVTSRIERNWTVTDAQGNFSACTETIWVRQALPSEVEFPANRDNFAAPALSCEQNPLDFNLTGYPTINGQPLDGGSCDLLANFTDQTLAQCLPAGKTLLRTWTVYDGCSGTVMQKLQIIRLEDKKPPVVQAPAPWVVAANPFSCNGEVILPQGQATDNCSSVTIVPGWAYGSGYGPFANIPLGSHIVTYTATDGCGNSATASTTVTVADESPPQGVCAGSLQISLTNDGTALLTALSVDDGSTDNCGPVELLISRDGVNFSPGLFFSCSDIGPPIPVTLSVTDLFGYENTCTSQISVRDFIKPSLVCPANITISCLQQASDFSLVGQAQANDNCLLQNLNFVDQATLNQGCNTGSVIRTWQATDGSGNTRSCSQVISLSLVNTLVVQFPPDTVINACMSSGQLEPSSTGKPLITGSACSSPEITHTDAVFSGIGGVCRYILRRWRVVEGCSYSPNGQGQWEHIQRIDVYDNLPPILEVPPALTLSASQSACVAQVMLMPAAGVDCSSLVFQNDSPYAFSAGSDASGAYPVGNHVITFKATDACGNVAEKTASITVVDQVAPVVLCAQNLQVPIGINGVGEVQIDQINVGVMDNCTPVQQLTMAVSPAAFDCNQTGWRPVTLQATDLAGNTGSCLTAVLVTAAPGICGDPGLAVGGQLNLENGLALPGVVVRAIANSYQRMVMTDSSGVYGLENLAKDTSYIIEPSYESEWLNGVTTYDLFLISRHILGVQLLNSPYKMIAADANRSGSITGFDIVLLRKIILGITDSVPGNKSWRFIPASYNFPNMENPWAAQFPERLILGPLTENLANQGFIAIKVGDVNNNAMPVSGNLPGDKMREVYFKEEENTGSKGQGGTNSKAN